MKTFSNIRFKKKTAQRFQAFSRRFFKTHTEAMDGMLDFFHYNEISPHEKLGPRMQLLMDYLKKIKEYVGHRSNATISIIKDIEKHQTQPTTAMMQLLFEHTPQKSKKQSLSKIRNKQLPKKDDGFFKSAMESIELQKENTILKQKLEQNKKQFISVLNKVKIVKGSFGKTRLQLSVPIEEYESIVSSIKYN